jgi:undecaprenyl-diphosphatase
MTKWPRIRFLILLFGLAGLNLLYIWKCPYDLCGDEAHYWEWSRHLDICYYSKGPVVAYIIWLATHIGGDTAFTIRAPAVLLSAGSMIITYALGRRLFNSELAAFLGVLFLVAAPMINIGGAAMTIDTPLCFFWLAAVGAWYLAIFKRRAWGWYLGGLCVSVGFLAKFTAIFLLPGLLLFLVLSKEDRAWLKTPHPYLAVLVGLLGFVPFVIWNVQHDWVTVRHLVALGRFDRSSHPSGGLLSVAETAVVLSPIVFCFMVYGIWRSTGLALRSKHRGHLFCQVFVWPVLIFYAVIGLHKHVPINWPFTSYLTGMIATGAIMADRLQGAEAAARSRLREWIVAAVALGFVISLALRYTYVFYPIAAKVGIPVRRDHAAAYFIGWHELGQRVSALSREMEKNDGREPFIFSDNYGWASLMAFYAEEHPETYCINVGQRHSQYDFWPGIVADGAQGDKGFQGRNGIFVPEVMPGFGLSPAFQRVEPVEPLNIVRCGVLVKKFQIYKCYGFKGWTPPTTQPKY